MTDSDQFHYSNLYSLLEQRISKAQHEVLLVAPFIKEELLNRLLSNLDPSVKLSVVTRWQIDEILSGVSDIEVFEQIEKRSQGTLKIFPNLHGKYYRIDETCVFGSANLTQKALIETYTSNLEILYQTSQQRETEKFEQILSDKAVIVDSDYYTYVKNLVEELKEDYQETNIISQRLVAETNVNYSEDSLELNYWIPKSRNPENVFELYIGNENKLTEDQIRHARSDLSAFPIKAGLNKEEFQKYIGFYLSQMSIVKDLDDFLEKPRRFGEISKFLDSKLNLKGNNIKPKRFWQTLMRWLLFYLEERYEYKQPSYSEIFLKRNKNNL